HVRLPERAKNTHSDHSQQQDQIRPTKAALLGQRPTRDQAGEGWLRSFDRDPRAVEAMARALGIEAPLGQPFHCILHEERNASACLVEAAESGGWLYHDFHGPARGEAEWMSLAQVRAQQSRRGPRLGPAEHATWKLRRGWARSVPTRPRRPTASARKWRCTARLRTLPLSP